MLVLLCCFKQAGGKLWSLGALTLGHLLTSPTLTHAVECCILTVRMIISSGLALSNA